MSFLLLGLVPQKPITILDVETSKTSFPEFIDILRQLGAQITIGAIK